MALPPIEMPEKSVDGSWTNHHALLYYALHCEYSTVSLLLFCAARGRGRAPGLLTHKDPLLDCGTVRGGRACLHRHPSRLVLRVLAAHALAPDHDMPLTRHRHRELAMELVVRVLAGGVLPASVGNEEPGLLNLGKERWRVIRHVQTPTRRRRMEMKGLNSPCLAADISEGTVKQIPRTSGLPEIFEDTAGAPERG